MIRSRAFLFWYSEPMATPSEAAKYEYAYGDFREQAEEALKNAREEGIGHDLLKTEVSVSATHGTGGHEYVKTTIKDVPSGKISATTWRREPLEVLSVTWDKPAPGDDKHTSG